MRGKRRAWPARLRILAHMNRWLTRCFASRDAWSKDGKVEETVDKVLSPVEAKKVHELAKSAAIAAEVENDTQKGRDEHLQQTPTLLVMHKSKSYPVSGAVSYPILRCFLDQLLTQ